MLGRRAAWIARAVVVAVTLALAHDLTYLARYGSIYGEALAHAGHGPAWTNAVLVSLTLGVGLVLAAGIQLWRLRVTAAGADAGKAFAGAGLLDLARSWARLAPRLAVAVAILLTVQENIERIAIGAQAVDPAILVSPEYAGALAIVVAVAIAVSFVLALFRWRRDTLLARIHAAIAPRPRLLPARLPRRRALALRVSILGRRLGLRAPPPGVAIPIAA